MSEYTIPEIHPNIRQTQTRMWFGVWGSMFVSCPDAKGWYLRQDGGVDNIYLYDPEMPLLTFYNFEKAMIDSLRKKGG